MSRPFTLLIKPAGPDCNLACRYCFYTTKKDLFAGSSLRMNDAVLECLCRSYLHLRFPVSVFAWQGGEPTLMGLDFYQKAVRLQKQFAAPGQSVHNALQTNGILLNDSMCRFLADENFLLGISLDGPEEIHDYYRKDYAGRGTYARVMAAVDRCRKAGVEFNILVLLNDRNVESPDILFDFLTSQGFRYLQFIPCLEADSGNPAQPAPWSISPEQYGRFLCRLFDRWFDGWIEKLSIRTFDSILSVLSNGPPLECTFARTCSEYVVIEHNGDVFCCDFFVAPQTRLGSILDTPLEQLAAGPQKQNFNRQKRTIANSCLVCRFLDICGGGCVKDRIVLTGNPAAPSCFCKSYKMFFEHSLPRFQTLAASLASKKKFIRPSFA